MKKRPSYRELETRIKTLESEALRQKQSVQNSNRAQQYLDIAEVMLIAFNERDEIIFLNRKGYEMLDYEEGELFGKSWLDTCLPVQVRQEVKQVFDDILAGRMSTAEYHENIILTKQGRERLIAWHNTVLKNEAGQITGILSSGEDITERKKTEAALKESEERYRRITETVTDYIFTVQVENNRPTRTMHGPACAAVTGYTSEEFSADPYLWIRMVLEEDHAKVQEQASRILQGEDPGPIQHRIRRKDGSVRWVNNTPVPHRDASGRLISYDGLIRDITERIVVENALRMAQHSMENAPYVIGWVGAGGKFDYVNATGCQHFGFSKDEMLGLRIFDIDLDFKKENWPEFWKKLKETKTQMFETRHRTKNGRIIPVEIIIHLMEFEGQEYTLAFGKDITERKQAEEALRLAQYSMEHVPMIVSRLGADGRLLYANQAAQRSSGFSGEELGRMKISEVIPDITPQEWPGLWQRIKEKGSLTLELNYKVKDGRLVPAEFTGHFMQYGEQEFILTFGKSIAERKQAEELAQLQRDLAVALSSSNELKQALNLVLLAGLQIEGIDCGGVYIIDPRSGELDLLVHTGLSADFIKHTSHYAAQAPSTLLIKRGRPVFSQHLRIMEKADDARLKEGLRALAVLPIQIEERVIGALNLASHTLDEIPLAARSFLEMLAAQSAGAIARLQAEEALRVSQYSVEHAPFPMIRIDGRARLLYVNEATCRHFGYTKEELLSMKIADIDPDYSEERWHLFWQQLQEQGTISLESRHRNKKGQIFSVELTNHFMEFEGQQYVFSAAKNITERKLAENQAQLQRDLAFALSSTNDLKEALHLLIQTSTKIEGVDCGGIYLVDPVTGGLDLIMHVGLSEPFVKKISHFDADEPSAKLVREGKPVFRQHSQIAEKMDRERWQEGLRATAVLPVQAEGRIIAVMNLASHTQDEISPAARSALENLAAQVGGAIARLQAEEALRKSEEKYRDLVENISEVIWSIDEKGYFTYMSPTVIPVLGFQPSEMVGRHFTEWVHEEDLPKAKSRYARALSVSLEPNEYRLRTKSGDYRWFRFSSRPIYEGGRVTGIQGLSTDITLMKHLEAQLRQAQKMEAIGTLAGGIAHDFNNILGIIVGNAELALLDVQEKNPAYHNLEEIRKACLRAREVVLQILSFSRQAETVRKPLKLGPLLRESLKLLRSSIPSSINIQQRILCQKDTIMADATQISQVLLNLCTNALHAMREKGGMLEIALSDEKIDEHNQIHFPNLRPGDYVKLSVRDTGCGIDSAIRDRIFDPYFTTKKVGEGTGLGLAVVHGIVQGHGGAILVESQINQGTTFHILLPCISAEPEKGTPLILELPKGDERILFVEDERAVADALQMLLEKLGYLITVKTNSLEALETFRNEPEAFDLVITDQTMPVMTGMSLAKEMFQIRPEIPIILCTGYSEQVNEDNAKALGIKAFIMKPILLQELAKKLREILDQGGKE